MPRTASESFTGISGIQALKQSPAALSREFTKRWMWSRASGTQTSMPTWNASVVDSALTCCTTVLASNTASRRWISKKWLRGEQKWNTTWAGLHKRRGTWHSCVLSSFIILLWFSDLFTTFGGFQVLSKPNTASVTCGLLPLFTASVLPLEFPLFSPDVLFDQTRLLP